MAQPSSRMAHYCMHRTSPAYRQHGLPAQRAPRSVVAELEGVLLKDADTFPYFMLVAFEASGIPRFAALLLLWPLLRLLELLGLPALALRAAALVATAGVRESDVEAVARAVLPKFLLDDVDAAAWRVFGACAGQRVVVTRMPRVMVEAFARAHLRADAVVGCDLGISRRLGRTTGIVSRKQSVADEVRSRFAAVNDEPDVGLGRSKMARSFMSLCKDQRWLPFANGDVFSEQGPDPLPPVIFHDGRLARRPTPHMSLVILLLLPLGALITLVRIVVGLTVPFWTAQLIAPIFGGAVTVRGRVPLSRAGVLYVCTHRTLLDPVVLASVLGHRVSAATYSISRFSEILSPIPTVRLTRDRKVDAARIQAELMKGDVIVCPEGTTCREPFLLRFSPLFAELTDRIVPVAINCRVGFFYPTTARGWKAMDPIFLFMNPWAAFEVTFLSQLPEEATCAGGKNPVDVANHVQRLLADALGFQCTNLTRRDKYWTLAGNDGLVDAKAVPAPLHAAAWLHRVKRVCQFLEHKV